MILPLQVAKSIKIVMTNRSASVVVKLDMDMIQDALLSIDANVVRESILKTPRIKLKQEVRMLLISILELLRVLMPLVCLFCSILKFWTLRS